MGGSDVSSPEFNLDILRSYASDLQFVLIILALASIAWLWRRRDRGLSNIALIMTVNLTVSVVFFFSHPIFTPYYTLPVIIFGARTLG